MRVVRITTNLPVADIEAAKGFYTDFLGLSHGGSTSDGWRASPRSRVRGHTLGQLVTGDATAPEDSSHLRPPPTTSKSAYRGSARAPGYESATH